MALDVPGPQPDHRRAGRATVVVEAGAGSGALLTAADGARSGAGRWARYRAGSQHRSPPVPMGCIAGGAALVRDAQDVLDRLFGAGERDAVRDRRPPLDESAREAG